MSMCSKIFLLKPVTAVFAVVLIFVQCSKKNSDHTLSNTGLSRIPVQEGWNSRLYVTREGKKQAVVWYGHMVKYDSTRVVNFNENIQVDFYNSSGEHVSNLKAKRGVYKEDTEDVIAFGNVIVKSDSGISLYTEKLMWDNKRAKILSDTLVMITTADRDTIWGKGFESNADLTRRVIRSPWGVGNRHVDLSRIEREFSNSDTTGVPADSSLKKE